MFGLMPYEGYPSKYICESAGDHGIATKKNGLKNPKGNTTKSPRSSIISIELNTKNNKGYGESLEHWLKIQAEEVEAHKKKRKVVKKLYDNNIFKFDKSKKKRKIPIEEASIRENSLQMENKNLNVDKKIFKIFKSVYNRKSCKTRTKNKPCSSSNSENHKAIIVESLIRLQKLANTRDNQNLVKEKYRKTSRFFSFINPETTKTPSKSEKAPGNDKTDLNLIFHYKNSFKHKTKHSHVFKTKSQGPQIATSTNRKLINDSSVNPFKEINWLSKQKQSEPKCKIKNRDQHEIKPQRTPTVELWKSNKARRFKSPKRGQKTKEYKNFKSVISEDHSLIISQPRGRAVSEENYCGIDCGSAKIRLHKKKQKSATTSTEKVARCNNAEFENFKIVTMEIPHKTTINSNWTYTENSIVENVTTEKDQDELDWPTQKENEVQNEQKAVCKSLSKIKSALNNMLSLKDEYEELLSKSSKMESEVEIRVWNYTDDEINSKFAVNLKKTMEPQNIGKEIYFPITLSTEFPKCSNSSTPIHVDIPKIIPCFPSIFCSGSDLTCPFWKPKPHSFFRESPNYSRVSGRVDLQNSIEISNPFIGSIGAFSNVVQSRKRSYNESDEVVLRQLCGSNISPIKSKSSSDNAVDQRSIIIKPERKSILKTTASVSFMNFEPPEFQDTSSQRNKIRSVCKNSSADSIQKSLSNFVKPEIDYLSNENYTSISFPRLNSNQRIYSKKSLIPIRVKTKPTLCFSEIESKTVLECVSILTQPSCKTDQLSNNSDKIENLKSKLKKWSQKVIVNEISAINAPPTSEISVSNKVKKSIANISMSPKFKSKLRPNIFRSRPRRTISNIKSTGAQDYGTDVTKDVAKAKSETVGLVCKNQNLDMKSENWAQLFKMREIVQTDSIVVLPTTVPGTPALWKKSINGKRTAELRENDGLQVSRNSQSYQRSFCRDLVETSTCDSQRLFSETGTEYHKCFQSSHCSNEDENDKAFIKCVSTHVQCLKQNRKENKLKRAEPRLQDHQTKIPQLEVRSCNKRPKIVEGSKLQRLRTDVLDKKIDPRQDSDTPYYKIYSVKRKQAYDNMDSLAKPSHGILKKPPDSQRNNSCRFELETSKKIENLFIRRNQSPKNQCITNQETLALSKNNALLATIQISNTNNNNHIMLNISEKGSISPLKKYSNSSIVEFNENITEQKLKTEENGNIISAQHLSTGTYSIEEADPKLAIKDSIENELPLKSGQNCAVIENLSNEDASIKEIWFCKNLSLKAFTESSLSRTTLISSLESLGSEVLQDKKTFSKNIVEKKNHEEKLPLENVLNWENLPMKDNIIYGQNPNFTIDTMSKDDECCLQNIEVSEAPYCKNIVEVDQLNDHFSLHTGHMSESTESFDSSFSIIRSMRKLLRRASSNNSIKTQDLRLENGSMVQNVSAKDRLNSLINLIKRKSDEIIKPLETTVVPLTEDNLKKFDQQEDNLPMPIAEVLSALKSTSISTISFHNKSSQTQACTIFETSQEESKVLKPVQTQTELIGLSSENEEEAKHLPQIEKIFNTNTFQLYPVFTKKKQKRTKIFEKQSVSTNTEEETEDPPSTLLGENEINSSEEQRQNHSNLFVRMYDCLRRWKRKNNEALGSEKLTNIIHNEIENSNLSIDNMEKEILTKMLGDDDIFDQQDLTKKEEFSSVLNKKKILTQDESTMLSETDFKTDEIITLNKETSFTSAKEAVEVKLNGRTSIGSSNQSEDLIKQRITNEKSAPGIRNHSDVLTDTLKPSTSKRKSSEISDINLIKRVEFIDNSKRLSDTQKFNILLDSYEILDPLIVKKTLSQANADLPAQVASQHTNQRGIKQTCKCVEDLQKSILNQTDCQCEPSSRKPGDPPNPCQCVYNGKVATPTIFICSPPVITEEDKCKCNIISDELAKQKSPSVITGIIEKPEMRTSDWASTDIDPEEIGVCLRRGFRADNMTLNGEEYLDLKGVDKLEYIRSAMGEEKYKMAITFSERKTPLEFLIGLGFSVDEASTALKNEYVKNRLEAAITEARVWANYVSALQGTLLYLLAFKSRVSSMRYFLQIVEAIINRRISDAVKLDGFLQLLDQLESGYLPMLLIFGTQTFDTEDSDGQNMQKHLQELFVDMHEIASISANEKMRTLTKHDSQLLEHLTTYYRPGLYSHLVLLAKYVGMELVTSTVQVEAAMIYLARQQSTELDVEEFEEYCGIVR